MSETQTLLLGFIAGATILLGLPLGRVQAPRLGTRQFLSSLAIGILLFLVWDVLVHAYDPLDVAFGQLHDGKAGIGPVLGYGALFFAGLTVGLLSLVYYERWLSGPGQPRSPGPGAVAPGELTAARAGIANWSAARRMSLLIAVGIGLHNFGEGLAIGGSAATGAIGLATILVIGFCAAQWHRGVRHRGSTGRRR
jgi:zinc transporter, ZIP family